jgi:hypothetical protein
MTDIALHVAKSNSHLARQKKNIVFMEPKGPLPRSQEPAIRS